MLLNSLATAGRAGQLLAPAACSLLPKLSQQFQQARGMLWSVEKEQGHKVGVAAAHNGLSTFCHGSSVDAHADAVTPCVANVTAVQRR